MLCISRPKPRRATATTGNPVGLALRVQRPTAIRCGQRGDGHGADWCSSAKRTVLRTRGPKRGSATAGSVRTNARPLASSPRRTTADPHRPSGPLPRECHWDMALGSGGEAPSPTRPTALMGQHRA